MSVDRQKEMTERIKVHMKRSIAMILTAVSVMTMTLAGCSSPEETELVILAAASLTDVCNEIKTMYEEENPNVTLSFAY